LRGKAESSGGKLGHAFGLSERGDEGEALKPFFERPGCVVHRPCLDKEETRRVEAESNEARPVRVAPFARGFLGEAPEQEVPAPWLGQDFSDRSKSKAERGRGVAIGSRLDLMQTRLVEPVQGRFGFRRGGTECPSPLVGEGRFAPARSAGMANRERGTFFREGENGGGFTPLRPREARSCSPTRGERDCLDVRE